MLAHVEGATRPTVNGTPLAGETVQPEERRRDRARRHADAVRPGRLSRTLRPLAVTDVTSRSHRARVTHFTRARCRASRRCAAPCAGQTAIPARRPLAPHPRSRAANGAMTAHDRSSVLGCSGAIAAGCRTTSFLLDDDVLVDAGTGVGDLPLEALAQIEHILISHSHLDHMLSIGLLADSVMPHAPGRGAAADPGARAARDARGAAHPHLQRRHLARLHPPAERRARRCWR